VDADSGDDGLDEATDPGRYESLVGRYIVKTIEIEHHLHAVIAQFFRVDGRYQNAFDRWVLQSMDFSKKLDVLKRILDEFDCRSDYQATLTQLTRMMERRNALAHTRYSQTIEIGDGPRTYMGLHAEDRKAGSVDPDVLIRLDLVDLEAELTRLDELVLPLTALMADSSTGNLGFRVATDQLAS
jgi:hypothetical protein